LFFLAADGITKMIGFFLTWVLKFHAKWLVLKFHFSSS
jgi:hypothetical protein